MFDEFQRKALATWYKPDNPLHLDPTHPAIKLAGEAGELLDLWGKHQYKPNFNWWDCKRCGHSEESHSDETYCNGTTKNGFRCDCKKWTPLVLDELGDFSYYLRILAYQAQLNFSFLTNYNPPFSIENATILNLLVALNTISADVLDIYIHRQIIYEPHLFKLTGLLLAILKLLDCPLEKLIELNYQKLNSEPSNHGWKDAR